MTSYARPSSARTLAFRAPDAARAPSLAERLLDDVTELVCVAAPDGRITYVNRAWQRVLGYDADDLVTLSPVALVAPEDRERYLAVARRLQSGESIEAFEAVLLAKDGRRVVCRGHAHADMVDDPAAPGGRRCVQTRAVYRDLTVEREAEAALRASETFSRSVLEASPDCVKTLDLDGRLLTMNGPGRCLMEVDDICLVAGADWPSFWTAGGREPDARSAIAAARAGGLGRFQGFCPTAKGTPKWWDVVVTPIPGPDGLPARLLAVSREVTEARRAAAEAEREHAFVVSVLEHISDGVVACDAAGNLTVFNRAARKFHGLDADVPREAWVAQQSTLFHEDGVTPMPLAATPLARALGGEHVHDEAIVIAPHVGTPSLLRTSGRRFEDADGAPLGAVIVLRDVTEQARGEAALRESETRVRGSLEASLDALFIYRAVRDAEGRLTDFEFTDANARAGALLGMPHDDLIGQRLCELFPVMRTGETYDAFCRVVETGEPYVDDQPSRDPRMRARWVRLQAVRVGDGLGVTARDITDQKVAEESLRALALADELTGVHNRRGFMMLAEREWQRAQREHRGAVLACVDLDDFKRINDSWGHAEGDAALRTVADVLRSAFRGADVIGRLGGDEFAVLIVPAGAGARGRDVEAVAQRLRGRVAEQLALSNIAGRAAGRPYDIAMSVGTVVVEPVVLGRDADLDTDLESATPGASSSLVALMVVADERLYEEKRARREEAAHTRMYGTHA